MGDDLRRKKREYMRRWRASHPENRDYQRAYHASYRDDPRHREVARERSRKWWSEHGTEQNARRRAAYVSRPRRYPSGPTHPNWKGDRVSYPALHHWIVRERGRPSRCELCGTTSARKFEWANKDHRYRRVLGDWFRACTSCHRKHDRRFL